MMCVLKLFRINYSAYKKILVLFVMCLLFNRCGADEKNGATPLSKEQILHTRLSPTSLLKYTSYKDVSILHFHVPPDTKSAFFTFKAYDEYKSGFQQNCQQNNISLHLKAGSYPVINPDNTTVPKHCINETQRFQIYSKELRSDEKIERLLIDRPQGGNWFAVAFISWSDPENERIEQQGLTASCETLLLSEMLVERVKPIILYPNQSQKFTLANNGSRKSEIFCKFRVPENVGITTTEITLENVCTTCPNINFYVQSNGLPSERDNIYKTIIKNNKIQETLTFNVQPGMWHFIAINFTDDGEVLEVKDNIGFSTTTVDIFDSSFSNYSSEANNDYELDMLIKLSFDSPDQSKDVAPTHPVIFQGVEFYPLFRQTHREFFMFDYDLLPDDNGTIPVFLNITEGTPVGLRFSIGDVYDIGGTLSFAVSMKHENKEDVEKSSEDARFFVEKLADKTSNRNNTVEKKTSNNQTIIVCIRLRELGQPIYPDSCLYGKDIYPAAVIVNNFESEKTTGLIHVPFPESGEWYITLNLFCHSTDKIPQNSINKGFILKNLKSFSVMKQSCPCKNKTNFYKSCMNDMKCMNRMNETETLKMTKCLMDPQCTDRYHEMMKMFRTHQKMYATNQNAVTKPCNASVVFALSSNPCIGGKCGRYGRCYHYMSGGFVFSTCVCTNGYRGWDCTDDSKVPSSLSILIASLFLTLSNLLFLPSIYFAVRCKFYTESVVYFFAMFFSAFYHACDAGDNQYTFCLVKLAVLQFCDFYCGLLSIWVTLVAMAHIRQSFVSILQICGAILLAFGAELNKQSLWVFLAPALTGICIISSSWAIKCRKTKTWFPSRKYLRVYMPLGSAFVVVGLVCYAFLQTKENYYIVHSVWHMVMALSLLCLLPNRKSFLPKR